DSSANVVRVKLLGPFSVSVGGQTAGPWPRPVAKRLCGLLLVSPERRLSRTAACEALFPRLGPHEALNGLSKALSLAHAALSALGRPGQALIQADRNHIWADPAAHVELDVDVQEERLRRALGAEPGLERDDLLVEALAEEGHLLEDEPLADWAVRPREHLEWTRQEARLALARDRAKGFGRSNPSEVVDAWEACLSHDPSCEEAASALVRVYGAQKRLLLLEAAYGRCHTALEEMGLRTSPALEQLYTASRPAARPQSSRAEASSRPAPRDERRLVTVLFAELTGPVVAGKRFGPEDVRDIVGGALAGVVTHVESLGGTVTSVSGAGLVALFGAPVAHEDDPERALRAAYRSLDSVGGNGGWMLARLGVETGQAVVGPLYGSTSHYGAFGDVVATAAALQSVAKPGSVLVGPATRAAAGGSFLWGPTEEVATSPALKGILATYVERPTARPTGQVGRRGLAGSAPVVGREAELAALHELLRLVTAGKGGVVLVTGEPGLGKTRLVAECRKYFMGWVGAASGRLPLWLEGRAASYAAASPYGLYQQLLAAWLGVVPEEGPSIVRVALDRAMEAVFRREQRDRQTRLLCHLMGLEPTGAEPELSALTPEQLQKATFEALRAVVSKLAGYGPTVLVLEDLHWSDPTSLHLTEEICSLAEEAPLLLFLTRRPEPDPGVSALEAALAADQDLRLSRLELAPLDVGAERQLARWLLGGEAPEPVVDAVSRGVEGNPLFLEERLASLLETGALARDEEGWSLDHNLPEEIPEALERLVRSRIDRLDAGPHDAIVAASVLGPEFSMAALRAATDLDGDLTGALSALCTEGLLTELRKVPEPVYRFRHALIQEATYRGLVSGERRRLHARAAWGLEEATSNRLDEVAAVLGHHFAMAGEAERALHYLERAGDRAASAFANDEAIGSYRYALDLLGRDGADSAWRGTGATVKAGAGLRHKLGAILLLTGRHGEARAALHEGLRMLGGRDDFSSARLHELLGGVEVDCHEYDAALDAYQAAAAVLGNSPGSLGPPALDLWINSYLGQAEVHYWRDETDQMAVALATVHRWLKGVTPRTQLAYSAAQLLLRSVENRERIDEEMLACAKRILAASEGICPPLEIGWRTFVVGYHSLWYGDLDGAEETLTEALSIAERIGSAAIRALGLSYLNLAALRRGDPARVSVLAPQAMEAAYAASRPQYAATAKASLAWVAWKTGRLAEVEALAQDALASWPAASWQPFHWVCLWPLIAVRLAAGKVAGAVEAARQILPAPQQRLPDELEAELQAAIGAWENKAPEQAGETLARALELAQRLRYA
ncbi:MAG TPA: AAA family ATPase, partial [Acidimicrobiales bacterium]|nr:AAA family ATPase [Acidimicrobiales bacterium]